MYPDVEDALVRELHQVADGVEVPAMPPLSSEPHPRPGWQPLLVAAVVLVVLGAVTAVVTLSGREDEIQPMPSPTPSPTVATDDATEPEPLSTAPPTVPYVVDSRLFVAGEQVPGNDWAYVTGTDTGWLAGRFDSGYTYWWGHDAEPRRIEGSLYQPPALSRGGGYWAGIFDQGGKGLLTGAETGPGGEGLGGTPIDLTNRDGVLTSVAAVTDDGLVITRGEGTSILWRPLVDGETVVLADTAPDQVVLGDTDAGLLVVDAASADNIDGGRFGDVYLADISQDGEITRLGPVPNHDKLVASGSWLAWVQVGKLGGEVSVLADLQVQRLDGSDPGTLTPPEGWWFGVGGWKWEDDDHLIGPVVEDGADEDERMVRCRPDTEECVLLDTPDPGPTQEAGR